MSLGCLPPRRSERVCLASALATRRPVASWNRGTVSSDCGPGQARPGRPSGPFEAAGVRRIWTRVSGRGRRWAERRRRSRPSGKVSVTVPRFGSVDESDRIGSRRRWRRCHSAAGSPSWSQGPSAQPEVAGGPARRGVALSRRSSALQSQAERWTGNRGHGSPPTGRWGVDLSSRHRYGVKQNESLGRVRHLQASPRPCIARPGAAALQRPKALPGRASLMRPAGSMVITVFFLFLFSFFCFYSSSGTPWCMRRGRFHYDSQQLAGEQQQRGQAQRVADGVSGWRRGQWRWPRPAPALGLASRSFAWLRVVPSRANTFFFLVPAEDALHTAEPSRVLPSGAEPSGADWGRAASPARPCRARPGH